MSFIIWQGVDGDNAWTWVPDRIDGEAFAAYMEYCTKFFERRLRSAGDPGHREHRSDQGNADQAMQHDNNPS